MSCGFDKGLLAAFYDGEATPDERAEVERHLGGCPECARDLDSMKRLSGVLKPLAGATAPLSIAEGVLREVGSRKSAPRPWLQWGVAAAASILVAVGVFAMLDRRAAPEAVVATDKERAPAKKPAFSRDDGGAKRLGRSEGKRAAEAPAAPAPAAEMLDRDEARSQSSELKQEEPPAYLAELAKIFRNWTGMQFVRVKSPDPAAVRGIVEAFLEERKLQEAPEGPVLTLNNLKVELTDADLKELERRLAAYKETTLVRTSLEEERKRLTELSKLKAADAGKDDAPADKERSARGRSEKENAPKRTWVLFVFESAEAKK